MFRGFCLLLGVCVLVGGTAACNARSTTLLYYPHASRRNLTESPHEHYQKTSNIAQHDSLMLVEDLDLLFMTDRPGRLTRWHSR